MAQDTRNSTLHLHCTRHTAHGTSSLLLRSTQHMAHDTRYSNLHLHCTRHTAHGTSSLLLRSTQHMAHDTRYSTLHLHCTRHTAHGSSSCSCKAHRTRRTSQINAHSALNKPYTPFLHSIRHKAQMFVGVKGTLVGQRAQRASYICITHHTAIPPQRHATFDFWCNSSLSGQLRVQWTLSTHCVCGVCNCFCVSVCVHVCPLMLCFCPKGHPCFLIHVAASSCLLTVPTAHLPCPWWFDCSAFESLWLGAFPGIVACIVRSDTQSNHHRYYTQSNRYYTQSKY